jgi:virulence factor Mce-like protein
MNRLRHDKAMLGFVSLLVGLGLFAVVFSHLPARLTAPGGATVTARFHDIQTLTKGDPVRVRGVEVGAVKRIELQPGARTADLELTVSDDALPLYADAHASVRWRTLFGAAFYVDLDPGTPGAGRLASNTLTLAQTDTQVVLEDVTSTVRGQARDGLRSMMQEFPRVLADPAAPAQALDALASGSPALRAGYAAVGGEQRGDLGELVVNGARVVQALDTPTDSARAVVEGAATTFAATGRRRADIRRALTIAAGALPRVRDAALRLDATLALADPLVERLDDAAGPLEPAARRLTGTLELADDLLVDVEPLMANLRPAVESLASTARAGAPVIAGLRPSLARTGRRILPALAKRSAESDRPVYQLIGPAFAGMTGTFAGFDGFNNFIRFTANFSETSINTAVCQTALTDPRPGEVATCQGLVDALGTVLGPGGDPGGARR